jgi:hypothetical protein
MVHGRSRVGACASARDRARHSPTRLDEPLKLLLDQARVEPLLQRDRAFDDQLAPQRRVMRTPAQFRRERQQQQVCRGDPVYRGDERDGDAATERRGLAETLHHVNEAENGAEDTERRRIAGRGFEHVGRGFGRLAMRLALDLENLSRDRRARAVDDERRREAEEGIGHAIELRLDRDRALAPCKLREPHDRGQRLLDRRLFVDEHAAHRGKRLAQDRCRKADEHRCGGSAEDDERRRRLPQRGGRRALEHLPGDHHTNRRQHAERRGEFEAALTTSAHPHLQKFGTRGRTGQVSVHRHAAVGRPSWKTAPRDHGQAAHGSEFGRLGRCAGSGTAGGCEIPCSCERIEGRERKNLASGAIFH